MKIIRALRSFPVSLLGLLFTMTVASAQAGQFHGTVTKFDRDQCFVLDRFSENSGAKYRAEDSDQEQKLCKVDFRDKNVGLCPKTWSTSPGTIIFRSSSILQASPTRSRRSIVLRSGSSKGKSPASRNSLLTNNRSTDNLTKEPVLPTPRRRRFIIISRAT